MLKHKGQYLRYATDSTNLTIRQYKLGTTMQVLHLDTLPEFARQELMDFYQFLLQKYATPSPTTQPKKINLAPRLVKPFTPLNRGNLYER